MSSTLKKTRRLTLLYKIDELLHSLPIDFEMESHTIKQIPFKIMNSQVDNDIYKLEVMEEYCPFRLECISRPFMIKICSICCIFVS